MSLSSEERLVIARRLAVRIRSLRQQKGLTQTQLASRAGLRPSNMNRIEVAANHLPDLDTLIKIGRALQVPVTALVGEDGN